MRKLAVLSLFIILISRIAFSQDEDYKAIFLEAESYFLFEEYKEALPSYLKLLKVFPNNDNLNYRIGVCYLNDPLEKARSIEYLEKAVKNIDPNYKENNFKETKAPYEALFYLGNAYRVNNMLDKARKTYEKFKQNIDTKIYDADLVDEQIAACKNAERREKDPLDLVFTNIGDTINSRFNDVNPVVNSDETAIVYVQQQQFYDAVFYSTKVNGKWQFPRNIMFELGFDNYIYPTSISADGTELYLYGVDDFLGTIYVSKLVNGLWTKAKKLNDNINTKYWESHASISYDGKSLYFTSNRKGGYGGLDIYVSHRDAKGDWGPPVNLGPNINTKYNEESPFITEDGKTLYFSSYGHNSMGGYDVYYSNLLDNGEWSVPINAGYPINSPDDDVFFMPVKNGNIAYYSRYIEGSGSGKIDIYRYEIFSDAHPHKFLIHGMVSLSGIPAGSEKNILVSVFDRNHKDTVDRVKTNEKGEYTLTLPAGDYDIFYSLKGFNPKSERLSIPKGYKQGSTSLATNLQSVEKPAEVKPEIVPPPPGIMIKEKYFELTAGDLLNIRLDFDRPGNLYITARVDSAIVKSETFGVKEGHRDYAYKVLEGKNIIEFRHVDQNQVPSIEYVVIDGKAKTPEATAIVMPLHLKGSDNPSELLDGLKKLSEGNLRNILGDLDLQKAHVGTASELIQYLLLHADEGKYSRQDVISLLTIKASHLSLQELVNVLAGYADGNLKKALLGLDLQNEGITNEAALIDYLLDSAAKYGYTRQDVYDMLSKAAANGYMNAGDLLKKMMQGASPGLKKFMQGLNLDSLNIKDAGQLLDYLFKNAAKNGFTEKDVIKALMDMMSSMPLDQFRKKLAEVSSGNLKAVLESLDLAKENIHSISELIDWLLNQAPLHGYTQNDVFDALIKLALEGSDNVAGLANAMQENSADNLRHLLLHTNPSELLITSNDALVDYLINKASEHNYTREDVMNSMAAIAYEGDATDVQYHLAQLAGPDFRKRLALLNLKDEKIKGINGMLHYLQQDLSRSKMPDSVYRNLFAGYLATSELQYILEQLTNLADGNLKSTLRSLDIHHEKLQDIDGLTSYLLGRASQSGYTTQDLFSLLEKYRESLILNRVTRDAIQGSHDSVLSAVLDFDPFNYPVFSRPGFVSYMESAMPRYLYSKDELQSLWLGMPGYRIPPSALLTYLAGTGIKADVKGIDLNKIKVQTSADLLKYLLEKKRIPLDKLAGAVNDAFNLLELNTYLSYLIVHPEFGLNDFAGSLNVKGSRIHSAEDLSSYILLMAGKKEVDLSQATRALASLIGSHSLSDYTLALTDESSGDLSGYLEKINTEKDGMHNLTQLARYILGLTQFQGHKPNDAAELLANHLSGEELDRFVQRMAHNAHGNLRKTLLQLDVKKSGLNTPADVISWLEKSAGQNDYPLEDVKTVLTKTAGGMIDNALRRIGYMQNYTSGGWLARNLPATITVFLLILLLFILVFSLRRGVNSRK